MEEKITNLIMVTADKHNKYYRMIPRGNMWTAEYGRVGANPMKKSYPMSVWNKIYSEKIAKGYQDKSDLHETRIAILSDNGFKPINENAIQNFVYQLQMWANNTLKSSYQIKSKEVTQMMIDEARKWIVHLSTIQTLEPFNDGLLSLFAVLPRRMSNVREHLASSINDFSKIISYESDLLDVMSSRVEENYILKNSPATSEKTILEAFGLSIRECTTNELEEVKNALSKESQGIFSKAWRVENENTTRSFNEYCKKHQITNKKLLFHGTKNQNYWNIFLQGLAIQPYMVHGRMFGNGIYFAPRAKKSIGYTSLKGSYWACGNSNNAVLAVYDVACGSQLEVNKTNPMMKSMNYKECLRQGFHSVYAHAGKDLVNDEVIVYHQDATNIKYLIELEK